MNSSVTAESDSSVMSNSCLAMSESSRSNGPSKFDSATRNPVSAAPLPAGPLAPPAPSTETGRASGDRATEDQLPRELPVRLRRLVLRGELGDRGRRDRGVGELHGARDDRLEHLFAERVDYALEHLARVQRARVVHRREDAVELDGGVQAV